MDLCNLDWALGFRPSFRLIITIPSLARALRSSDTVLVPLLLLHVSFLFFTVVTNRTTLIH